MASRLLLSKGGRNGAANWHRIAPQIRLYSLKPTTLESSDTTAVPKAGIDQDHHYTSTTATTTSTTSPTSDLNIRQVPSSTKTLPDGTTIPEFSAKDSTIPSTVSGTPEKPDIEAINAEVFHSRRARALGNASGGLKPASVGTPVDNSSGVNNPEFTATSSKVQASASKVMDELKGR
ncbi:hypothetical protein TWF481_002131 [Arthrobotrys musiformis]|uniref:Uncharacterized protein n=1 Tax=Arthrobotrys musiformis TaxID=47236 RepID=A0AAV9VTF5_9PEZI